MYELVETEYGIRMVTHGFIQNDEVKRMGREAARLVSKQRKGFGVLHDMRGMSTLPPEARAVMKLNMEAAKNAGMGRSAQILDDPVTTLQFNRLAREVGIDDTMRQIDASKTKDCERAAVDWIVKGIEPD